ncbi:MAG: sigma-70 family RNA polymerase sigma factor [Bacteroidetes bacterium]|nr:sigma-70 family RNA polymerase sigma factor [Bacteroidota bacterium]
MGEKEIVRAILNGDKELFKELVIEYQKFVLNICYRFLNNSDDAHDAAQEVFIEVYRTIGKFRGDSSLKTWIYRIAVTRSLNYLRDNKRNREAESFDEDGSVEHNSETPETKFSDKERRKILTTAINSLPDKQKAVFVLSKVEGASMDEVCKVMEISLKAAESLLMRAKKNLQKEMVDYFRSL